jgi:hypothetical protein
MARAFRRPLLAALPLLVSLALLAVAPTALAAQSAPAAVPAASCSPKAYAYAGLFSNLVAGGIKATVSTLATAEVTNGHVAGWIGVGGVHAGPNGEPEWLQTGIDTQAGGSTEIYAETTQAGSDPQYKTLVAVVQPGTPYRLAVLALPGQPNVWQVWLNGKPVTDPVSLPGSSRFAPMAMSESWDGGTPTCNGFAYRFAGLKIATDSGAWSPLTNSSTLTDAGYEILDRSAAGFTAASV